MSDDNLLPSLHKKQFYLSLKSKHSRKQVCCFNKFHPRRHFLAVVCSARVIKLRRRKIQRRLCCDRKMHIIKREKCKNEQLYVSVTCSMRFWWTGRAWRWQWSFSLSRTESESIVRSSRNGGWICAWKTWIMIGKAAWGKFFRCAFARPRVFASTPARADLPRARVTCGLESTATRESAQTHCNECFFCCCFCRFFLCWLSPPLTSKHFAPH